MTAEELERLSAADREALERRQSDVLHEFRSVMLRQRQIMQQLAEDIRAIERNFSATLIALIAELKHRHRQEKVQRYLEGVQEHMLSISTCSKKEAEAGPAHPPPMAPPANAPETFWNIVSTLSWTMVSDEAPVLVEDTPTYKNLFGTIDRVVDPHGRVVTNFTRIKAGSLLCASGGYLV